MRALILVDLQNDFLPGGALAVPHGDEVVPVAMALAPNFKLVVATADWHPADHGSFASQHPGHRPGDVIDLYGLGQVLWPDHCVRGSRGADFAPGVDGRLIHRVFQKGTDRDIDSYSGFFDNGHRKATGLGAFLKARGVDEVFVLGLATDYCVKFTALDAVREGFSATLVEDGARGVNLKAGDSERAVEEMRSAGVRVVASATLA
jgi:nicotinamidase/pyrazinamidase